MDGVSPSAWQMSEAPMLHHCECVTNRAITKKVNYQDKRLKQKLLPQNDVIMEENKLYLGSFYRNLLNLAYTFHIHILSFLKQDEVHVHKAPTVL